MPARPLVVTADPDVLDDLLRLAATVGVEREVATDPGSSRRPWATAPFVVVGVDAVPGVARLRLPRRTGVVVLGRDLDDAGIWEAAVRVGGEQVVFLPDAERWLADRFADAVEGSSGPGALVAVIGGRGGAGATTFACALAVTATRWGRHALLVDGDPLGGGIDLVFGGEDDPGLRWPGLVRTRGRVSSAALSDALPRMRGLSVLSWDRGEFGSAPLDAMSAVLAAGRRAHELVVVDLPRSLDEVSRAVLAEATTAVLVVPTEVRAAAAASRVVGALGGVCADLRLVTRGPSPTGLDGDAVAGALGLPLLADMRPEPHLESALEHGQAPGHRERGPLALACGRLLDDLLPELRRAA